MTPDIVSIVVIGLTLAGLILNGQRQTRREFEQLRAETTARTDKQDARTDQLKAEMIARMDQLKAEMIARMDKQDARMDQLKAEMIARMDKQDARTDKLTADVASLRREVSGLDSRLSRLEGAISATFFSRPPLVETAEHGD